MRRDARPFVLLEVGAARVTPFLPRRLGSFVHDWLERAGQLGDFDDNRPDEVRCVHPLVTLLEKLDGIRRRYPREPMEPATFIRHYEDAARIIGALATLPPLPNTPADLAADMRAKKQIAALPRASDPAFALPDMGRRVAIESAHRRIAPMYWGPRQSLDEACAAIRSWLDEQLPTG